MFTKTLALTGALAALVSSVPMAKRDVVWVTETEEAVVTVPVTTTVWVDPTGIPEHYGHQHGHQHQTTVHSTVIASPSAVPAPSSDAAPSAVSPPAAPPAPSSQVAPASSAAPSPSSVYVASSSPSTYVAPTTSSSVYVAPTTSSIYVALTTSSSVYVAPTTSSSVYVAPTTTEAVASSTQAAASSYSSNSGSTYVNSASDNEAYAVMGDTKTPLTYGMAQSGTSYSGDFTYYDVGTGACNATNVPTDHMVAISHVIFDSYSAEANGNSNHNPVCGKLVTITAMDGSSYQAPVWDRCVGCEEGDLDMPEDFFNTVTSKGDGRVHNMKWSWN